MPQSIQNVQVAELRNQMSQRIVRFHFVKKDGSLRECMGTVNSACIPSHARQQGEESDRREPRTAINFWDFLANGWRAINLNSQVFIIG